MNGPKLCNALLPKLFLRHEVTSSIWGNRSVFNGTQAHNTIRLCSLNPLLPQVQNCGIEKLLSASLGDLLYVSLSEQELTGLAMETLRMMSVFLRLP